MDGKIYNTTLEAIDDLKTFTKSVGKERVPKSTCLHDDICFGVYIRPADLVVCRDCYEFLCWIVGGFNGKFIHKPIREIWKDYGLDPVHPTDVIESVYTFTPLLTRSTKNTNRVTDDSDEETDDSDEESDDLPRNYHIMHSHNHIWSEKQEQKMAHTVRRNIPK